MSKKSRQAKKEARRNADAESLKRANDAAVLDGSTFVAPSANLEEANARLADASRVINMKEAKARAEKGKGGKVAEAKKQRKSAGGATEGRLPKLPRIRGQRKPRPDKPCECGCGGTTKNRFAPGHDSFLRGLVLRVHREIMTLADVEKHGGKAQREAVEREMATMKKEGKLTKFKAAPHAAKRVAEQADKTAKGKGAKVTKATVAKAKVVKKEAPVELPEAEGGADLDDIEDIDDIGDIDDTGTEG